MNTGGLFYGITMNMEDDQIKIEPRWVNRILPVSVRRQGEHSIIKYTDGTEVWTVKGTYHRMDGPAVIRGNGEKIYFINGIRCPENVKTDQDLMLYLVHL